MSVLAMILAVAMVVPGSGPEKVSGEMEQGLDLCGEWKGTFRHRDGDVGRAHLSAGWLNLKMPTSVSVASWRTVNEGEGKLQIELGLEDYLGIYHRDSDRVTICFRNVRSGYPRSFDIGDGQYLLILHLVKPRK